MRRHASQLEFGDLTIRTSRSQPRHVAASACTHFVTAVSFSSDVALFFLNCFPITHLASEITYRVCSLRAITLSFFFTSFARCCSFSLCRSAHRLHLRIQELSLYASTKPSCLNIVLIRVFLSSGLIQWVRSIHSNTVRVISKKNHTASTETLVPLSLSDCEA